MPTRKETLRAEVLPVFGRNLREARQANGKGQEDFAGTHPVSVSRYEHGEVDPSLSKVVDLARQLDVSPADLLKGL